MATLELHFRPMVSACISATATGPTDQDEIACFGTRGDGKTQGAFGAMIAHAQAHAQAGYPLPTKWLGAADTFESHKQKTHESLTAPMWGGAWDLRDGGKLAAFRVQGTDLVHLRLFGVNTQEDKGKLRAEAHGLWFEEPAPAVVLVSSSGIDEDSWALGITSCRLPSHRNPKLMTLNYPDEDHWTWQRFVAAPQPRTVYFRIPPGERASVEDRAKWEESLVGRPDLLRRLLKGEPGTLFLGAQVAVGYNAAAHVARGSLDLERHAMLYTGWDSGPNAHVHATIIGQRIKGRVRVLAGLVTEDAGLKQHLEREVLPWLSRRAPWLLEGDGEARIVGRFDPSMDTDEGGDIDVNPMKRLRRALPGSYRPGAVKWHARSGPMLTLFNLAVAGEPALEIDSGPDTAMLRKALAGRWYYGKNSAGTIVRDLPFKPNHPWEDLGDAFCHFVEAVAPSSVPVDDAKRPRYAKTDYDVYGYSRDPMRRVVGSVS